MTRFGLAKSSQMRTRLQNLRLTNSQTANYSNAIQQPYIRELVKMRKAIQRLAGKNQASAVQRTARSLSSEWHTVPKIYLHQWTQ